MMSLLRTMRVIAGAALVGAAGSVCAAQHALGDGRALDAGLSPQYGRYNAPVRDLMAEIRFRNLIVTGNAPGGLSFREDVGYTAPGEFTESVADDDIFTFQRDSYLSGLAGQGIRGIEALQYQMALTTGYRKPEGLTGTGAMYRGLPSVNLPGGRVSDVLGQQGIGKLQPAYETTAVTPQQELSLRQTGAFITTRSMSPTLLRESIGQDGRLVQMVASPILGVGPVRVPDPKPPEDQGLFGLTGRPSAGSYDEMMEDLELDREPPANDDLSAAFGSRRLTPVEIVEKAREALGQSLSSGGSDSARVRDALSTLSGQVLSQEVIDQLRKSRRVLITVAPSAQRTDQYAVHMNRAQELLVLGRFFDAEERFSRALSIRPGDAMAGVGRVHAELGAGLFRSATVNLRSVLATHPETIALRYDATLMPSKDRLGDVEFLLREMMDSAESGLEDAPLLLAYIGYQTGRPGVVGEGLDAMSDAVPDPLIQVLRRVWLDEPGDRP